MGKKKQESNPDITQVTAQPNPLQELVDALNKLNENQVNLGKRMDTIVAQISKKEEQQQSSGLISKENIELGLKMLGPILEGIFKEEPALSQKEIPPELTEGWREYLVDTWTHESNMRKLAEEEKRVAIDLARKRAEEAY